MTTIAHQTVVGEIGKPAAALIRWVVFVELHELIRKQEPNETLYRNGGWGALNARMRGGLAGSILNTVTRLTCQAPST